MNIIENDAIDGIIEIQGFQEVNQVLKSGVVFYAHIDRGLYP
jgi:hypothetical protein